MNRNELYVFTDFSTNQVDLRGFTSASFQQAMQRPIHNILVLSGNVPEAEYDEYTRFFTIRGDAAVASFFQWQLAHPEQPVKWVDYVSEDLLHQLTPGEIAELLYLRHMTRSWHSPFFYKLRNDYVYLPQSADTLRVYYRRISEFFNQFATRLSELVADLGTEGFSRYLNLLGSRARKPEITSPGREVMDRLRPLLSEGIIIDFSNVHYRAVTTLPIYLMEDRSNDLLQGEVHHAPIGYLRYDAVARQWQVETKFESDDFGG